MNTNQVAHIASLMGEPARTAMLLALMDGRALTASELAGAGRVSPATASRHLGLLLEAGLLCVERQGRHRYHRLASADVASLLENLMQLTASAEDARPIVRTGPKEAALRTARTCFDHLAGRLGVAVADHLVDEGAVVLQGDARVLPGGALHASLNRLGVVQGVTSLVGPSSRPLCRACLDWSERRPHVAGRLGALIAAHCLERGWLLCGAGSRALGISPSGALALRDWMGTARWREVTGD
jgi:DNA-binding transcriptional ArsR family regulator